MDLRQVGFIDPTGLRVLLGLHRDAQREGRAISLVPGPRPVQRIFELTATRALFHWRDWRRAQRRLRRAAAPRVDRA